MKKFVKVCLLLAAVCAILGVAACAAGAVMGAGTGALHEAWQKNGFRNWSWNIGSDTIDWEKEGNTVKTLDSFAVNEVDSLEIDLKYGTLDIKENDKNEITVKAEKNQEKFQVVLKDGVLNLEDVRNKSVKDHNYHILLLLPKGAEFQSIKINNDAGIIETDDITLTAQDINIKVSAGEIVAEHLEAAKLELRVGAGNADIDEVKAEDAEITCGVGNIDVELIGDEKDYNYEIACGIGNISINEQSYSSLGKDKMVDNHADKEIHLDCGVGNITLITEEEED